MDRLTKRDSSTTHENGVCCTHFNSKECIEVSGNCSMGCKWEEEAWSKLAEYEDLEEQRLLLRLPRYAYFIKNNKVLEGWVQEVVYCCCRKLLLDIRYDDSSLDSYRGYVGNDVFLTREEAEAKLKEMQENV